MKRMPPLPVENGVAAITGIRLDIHDRELLGSRHPDLIRAGAEDALRHIHRQSAVLSFQLAGDPAGRIRDVSILVRYPAADSSARTPQDVPGDSSRILDTVIAAAGLTGPADGSRSLSSDAAIADGRAASGIYRSETGLSHYRHFAEFLQRETWPAPRKPVPGLDYLYCIEPFSFSLRNRDDFPLFPPPPTKEDWLFDMQFHPVGITQRETQVVRQVLEMVKPLAMEKEVRTVSELTGISRTRSVEADPGAALCYQGFRELLARATDEPVFAVSIRLLASDPTDLQRLLPWVRTALLGEQPVTVLPGETDSGAGRHVLRSIAAMTPSTGITAAIWQRNDAPTVLKRLHRMLPLTQSALLSANTLLPAAVMHRETVTAGVRQTPAAGEETDPRMTIVTDRPEAVDESVYHSFYLNRQRELDRHAGGGGMSPPSAESGPGGRSEGLLPDRYRILGHLGSGGMGDVYRVDDTELDREVAIKILKPSLSADPDRVRQFKREVRLSQDLVHEGIVRMHHLDAFNGRYYCVMELVPGRSLAEHLSSRDSGMDQETVRFILMHICQAMAAAHRKGVIHRDLKPGNVMLLPDGGIKILDFGLACLKSNREAALTGSIGFMAPEILQGRPADERSDVFSVGAIGYEMLTLRKPGGYIAPDLGLGDVVSSAFTAVILEAMHGDPERRIQSMETLAERLFGVDEG